MLMLGKKRVPLVRWGGSDFAEKYLERMSSTAKRHGYQDAMKMVSLVAYDRMKARGPGRAAMREATTQDWKAVDLMDDIQIAELLSRPVPSDDVLKELETSPEALSLVKRSRVSDGESPNPKKRRRDKQRGPVQEIVYASSSEGDQSSDSDRGGESDRGATTTRRTVYDLIRIS